jgi:hypothetical protein
MIVLLVPIIVVLIPGLRLVPSLYAWRVKSRIYRWYGALIGIERAAMSETTSATERGALMRQLDEIDDSVNAMKMPLAYADQFYVLREHIGFVRGRLNAVREAQAASGDDSTQEADDGDDAREKPAATHEHATEPGPAPAPTRGD